MVLGGLFHYRFSVTIQGMFLGIIEYRGGGGNHGAALHYKGGCSSSLTLHPKGKRVME